MNLNDFLTALPIFATAFFLIIGERLKDNIYRSIAGVCSLIAAVIPNYPTTMTFVSAILAIYTFAMWIFQPTMRANGNPNQTAKE